MDFLLITLAVFLGSLLKDVVMAGIILRVQSKRSQAKWNTKGWNYDEVMARLRKVAEERESGMGTG